MGSVTAAALLSAAQAMSQCGPVISTFPYNEGFEAGPAWTAGGTASDWAWGTPVKPTISTPGGGTRSWCVGGLLATFYNNGQQSWLESPCFDLSALQYPWISFKLFWETERAYDGLGFQYSLDEGATWTNLGSATGPTDCLNTNWFNSPNIVGLNQAQPKQGWSGRIGATSGNCGGGGGSAGWVTASQCLSALAGESSVKFRFIFGAGTICNNFDGAAVDDVFIGEAPANDADFVFACNGSTVEFQDASTLCPSQWQWDFGDPASGASNTASGQAPGHTYAAGGTYTVSLTVTGPCNAPSTTTRTIYIAEPEFVVEQPTCSNANGSISVVLPNAPPGLTYVWAPGGSTASSLSGIGPGTYTVTVGGMGVCGFQEEFVLDQQGDPLIASAASTPVSCSGSADGSATVALTGGTPDFNYLWSPTGGDAATAIDLAEGTYTCTITDALGCSTAATAIVGGPLPLVLPPPSDASICAGQSVTLAATAEGGTAPYTYDWQPGGPVVSPGQTTVYTVAATDANGCQTAPASVTITVNATVTPAFKVDAAIGCTPHCTAFNATDIPAGATVLWQFGDGGTATEAPAATHCYMEGGTYSVTLTATDPAGCTGSSTLLDAVTAVASPVSEFFAVPPIATIDDPVFQFRSAAANADSWSWSFGDGTGGTSTETDPVYTYSSVGCFPVTLVVRNALGCEDSAERAVCVEDAFVLWVPNSFTPNGDGYNDEFLVVTSLSTTDLFELLVFDRWGQLVHSGDRLGSGWDGTLDGAALPTGVYPWTVRLKDRDGVVREARGSVTILR
jgi:gliding motility-associated-like protein